jgi:uncharacterized protein (TIGR02611 family)
MTTPFDETAGDTEESTSGLVRKVGVAVAGGTVTAAGVVMLVTPGPGIIAILGGLGILSTEFKTARRALNRLRIDRSAHPQRNNVLTMPSDRKEPRDPHHRSRRSG